MNSKWTVSLISNKVRSTLFICDFDMRIFLGRGITLKALPYFISSDNFWQFFLSTDYKHRNTCQSAETYENTRLIRTATSIQLALMRGNRNLCKLKHAQTWLHHHQVAWLPLSHAIKSYRELYSHTKFTDGCLQWSKRIVLSPFQDVWTVDAFLGRSGVNLWWFQKWSSAHCCHWKKYENICHVSRTWTGKSSNAILTFQT